MDELLELEEAGWASLCSGTGSDFYASVMADDGLMVLADGTVATRDEVVEALHHAPPWASYRIDDPRLLALGADAGALVYVGTGYRDDGSSFVAAMSSVYRRQGGQWKLVLYQQTGSA